MPVVKTKQTIDDVDPGGLPSVTATDSGACLTGMVKPDRATGSNSWTNRKPRNRRNNFVMFWEFDVLHAEHSKKNHKLSAVCNPTRSVQTSSLPCQKWT
ncbi:MAG: hypothetical protein ACI9PP_001396 [Halobacteriales archaeon]|jgi:hypothetical protein